MPKCVLCMEAKREQAFLQPDVAMVCTDCMELHQFELEDLRVFQKHQRKMHLAAPQKTPPPENRKKQEVFATADSVTCPNHGCGQSFEINPWFYDTVAECPSCQREFIIRPPKESTWMDALPANHPARRSEPSGKHGIRSSHELPKELDFAMPSIPKRKLMVCPECHRKFPVLHSNLTSPVTCPKCQASFSAAD